TGSDGSQTIALVRYRPDGMLDPTFNHTGIVVLDPSYRMIAAAAVFVIDDQLAPDDGRIGVVGTGLEFVTKKPLVMLAGFKSDGWLDVSGFGPLGVVYDNLEPDAQAGAAAMLPGHQILVGGEENMGTDAQPVEAPFVARFAATGLPDNTFFAGG